MSVLDGIICRHFNVDIVDLTKFVLNILHIESISTHLQHELINWFYVIGIIWYLLTWTPSAYQSNALYCWL